MDAKHIKSISSQIYRRFPEVAGTQPKVQAQSAPQAKSINTDLTYLITFRGSVISADGKSILRIVRVIANAQGRILKVTTSR
ncbi:MAG: hypothetical protein A2Z49_05305 [Chloroflexi bacterium RBG_19FT_COMBO_56_12]|nr:MAG: hypothetical protein A2Z49_05305 [Chloroflexi bacterium RBG_19FT_COMBO_56_12]